MKKHLSLAAAVFTISFGASFIPAQPAPQPAFSADAAAEQITNLDTLKAELKQYHDCTCKCGCYAHDLDVQGDRAIAFLRRRAAQRRSGEKLAVVLDIDESTLSNYQDLVGSDFAFNTAAFKAWVVSAQAPAIPGTLRIYKEAQRLGFIVFFLTGRSETERDATERNLRAQGFANWQQLTMRAANQATETAEAYKSAARRQIAAEGYKLALNVGDQWSDLKGNPEAEFSVKYPDPFYSIK